MIQIVSLYKMSLQQQWPEDGCKRRNGSGKKNKAVYPQTRLLFALLLLAIPQSRIHDNTYLVVLVDNNQVA